MSNEEIKQKIHQLVEEMDDEVALQMLYEEAVEYKTSSVVEVNELTADQWGLIEKAREEIKQGEYHTYDAVKEHFTKWLMK